MMLHAIGTGRNVTTCHRSRMLQDATGDATEHDGASAFRYRHRRGSYHAIDFSRMLPRKILFPDVHKTTMTKQRRQ